MNFDVVAGCGPGPENIDGRGNDMVLVDLRPELARLACLKDVQSDKDESTLVGFAVTADVHACHEANVGVEGKARSTDSGCSVSSCPRTLDVRKSYEAVEVGNQGGLNAESRQEKVNGFPRHKRVGEATRDGFGCCRTGLAQGQRDESGSQDETDDADCRPEQPGG